MTFWRAASGGVTVMVKVQPKSRKPGLQGTAPSADGERLRIGVTEAPVCAMLGRVLDVPASAVSVVTGATSREKRLLVTGDPVVLGARLEAL
jgi:uncharacterized protein YggU (UPF0235/DUF167 family)